jgi:large subunit ribosomal protein L17
MRHRKGGHKLGRTTSHRAATLRNLAVAMFEHGQIVTTLPKAKAVQPYVEKLVTLAKRGDLHSRRLVMSKLGHDRRAFAWLYLPADATDAERETQQAMVSRAEEFFASIPDEDSVERNRYGELRKCPRIVKHIFENVAPQFEDRSGGYTRIVRIGKRRIGDAAELCVLQFVGAEDGPEIGGNPSRRRRKADRRTAFAAQVRKSWGADAKPAEEAAPVATEAAEPEASADDAGEAESKD